MIKVNLGGKEQVLRFNQLSIEVFTKNINYEALGASSVYAMFFAGLSGAYYADRKEVDFTFSDVVDWVDALFIENPEVIKKVDAAFTETAVYRDWLKKFQEKVRIAVEGDKPKKKTAKK